MATHTKNPGKMGMDLVRPPPRSQEPLEIFTEKFDQNSVIHRMKWATTGAQCSLRIISERSENHRILLTLINSARMKWSDSDCATWCIEKKIYKSITTYMSAKVHFHPFPLACPLGYQKAQKKKLWEIVYCGRDNKCNHHFFPLPPLLSPRKKD